MQSGAGFKEALAKRFTAKLHPDLVSFRSVLILATEHGGAVVPCLRRLLYLTRSRQNYRQRVLTAIAAQKLSAIGITFSLSAIVLLQVLSNPKSIILLWSFPLGRLLALVAFLFMLLGAFLLFSLTREKV